MILSDREIQAAIARGALKLSPAPSSEAWSSTAVDLRLAKELVLWKRPGGDGVEAVVCPARPDYNFDAVRRNFSQPINISEEGYVFKPQMFLLGWTIEKIQLPHRSRLAARVEGKSCLARLGIGVHVTAQQYMRELVTRKGTTTIPAALFSWRCGTLDRST